MPIFSDEDILKYPNYVKNDEFVNWWTNLKFDDTESIEFVMPWFDKFTRWGKKNFVN